MTLHQGSFILDDDNDFSDLMDVQNSQRTAPRLSTHKASFSGDASSILIQSLKTTSILLFAAQGKSAEKEDIQKLINSVAEDILK